MKKKYFNKWNEMGNNEQYNKYFSHIKCTENYIYLKARVENWKQTTIKVCELDSASQQFYPRVLKSLERLHMVMIAGSRTIIFKRVTLKMLK